ncbi:MAG: glycosyltransferase family 87 protein [Candidatus Dormibacteria bacterium]
MSHRLRGTLGALVAIALLTRVILAARRALDGGAADYVAFATGARVVASGSRCLYCLPQQTAAQVAVLGYRPPPPAPGFPAPYANPPLAAWLLQPLAARPLAQALPLFVAAMVAALLIAGLLLARLLSSRPQPGRSRTRATPRVLVALACLSLPGATAILLGQWDPLILLGLALALAALASHRDLLAGLAASVIFLKPQLGILLGVALLLTGRRRLIGGFGLGVVIWTASTLLLIGPGGVAQWGRYVDARLGPQATFARGLAGLAAAAGGSARAVELTGLVIGAALVVAGVVFRDRLRADPEVALALGVAASLCCTPHVFSDDMLLLAPALVVWGVRRARQAAFAALALNLAFLLDEYVLPDRAQRLEGVVALAIVLGLAAALRPGAGDPGPGPAASPAVLPEQPGPSSDPHNGRAPSHSWSLSACPLASLRLPSRSPASP